MSNEQAIADMIQEMKSTGPVMPVWGERSATIGKLAAALSKAQAVLEAAKKDANNPFFKSKYADLSSVWAAVRGPLTANELSILQEPSTDNGWICVTTTLLHSSGEYVRSSLSMPVVKQDPQGYGSAVTYARRYALQSVMGIAPEDDDGNAASQQPKGQRPEAQSRVEESRGDERKSAQHTVNNSSVVVAPIVHYYEIGKVDATKRDKAAALIRANGGKPVNLLDTVFESPVTIDKLAKYKITEAEAFGG